MNDVMMLTCPLVLISIWQIKIIVKPSQHPAGSGRGCFSLYMLNHLPHSIGTFTHFLFLKIENISEVNYYAAVTSHNHILKTSGLKHLRCFSCIIFVLVKTPSFQRVWNTQHRAEKGCVCVFWTLQWSAEWLTPLSDYSSSCTDLMFSVKAQSNWIYRPFV